MQRSLVIFAAGLLLAIHTHLAGDIPASVTATPAEAHAKISGASGPWWSLRPLFAPAVPRLDPAEARWTRTPIDAFILSKLREKRLQPSAEADRVTLMRRLYFDLLGLPPPPEEMDAFVADSNPGAYEKLVDRLLASPHYGERWGRHWLDVVHYGDTHGYDKDKPRPYAWPYRDYVIRSFNDDKPYTRFILEQIAGDVGFPNDADAIEATGFIAAGPWDFIGHVEVPESKIDGQIARHLDRDDMVAATMGTFVSMTVQCAQCHHHKFDPISQEDYYSLQADFAALDRAELPYDRDPAVAQRRRELTTAARRLQAQKRSIEIKIDALAGPELAKVEKEIAELKASASAQERTRLREQQRQLREIPATVSLRKELADIERSLQQVESGKAKLPKPLLVYAGTVHDGTGNFAGTGPSGGKPRAIHVLVRGDVRKPRETVGPGALSAISELPARFELPKDAPEGDRRIALARWVTDRRNPLTWRSIVNRVWQYHFGRGLVDSPNDFGRMGQLPSHPELLDWLAAEFRDSDQSLKKLHRLIVISAAYRQASVSRSECAAIDSENRYLWRMNRRRLEAEAIRDAVLSVSGALNPAMYGPGFQDFVIEKPEHSPHYRYDLSDPNDLRTHLRSIYRFIVRSQPQPFLTTLDCADPSMLVDKRNETLTALQALDLLNDRFLLAMIEHFAARLGRSGGNLNEKVEWAFRLCFGRHPIPAERAAIVAYAQQHGLANACRVLLNLNEFIFVD